MHFLGRWTKSATLLLLASTVAVPTWASPLAQLEDASSLSSTTSPATSIPTSAVKTTSTTTATGTLISQSSVASGSTSEALGSAATDIVTTTFSTTAPGSAATSDVSTSPGGPENPFPQCHEADRPYAPFCQPTNGSDVYVGETYYITWDPDYFPINSTITLELSYVNTSTGGDNAWSSAKTPNAYGYSTLTMDKAWLQGSGRNNLTLTIISLAPNANAKINATAGPVVSLTNRPATHYPAPPTTKAPNRLGLLVGIPVGLCFFVFVLCGLFFGMRKHRKIGLGNVMGRRRGYGIGKSRRQRLGKNGAIRLGEDEGADGGKEAAHFKDEPAEGVELQQRSPEHAREVNLGSLADSPSTEGFGHVDTHGNAFRDEISRQRAGR